MENIDLLETEHFEQMAAQWWDPTGPCQPLHDLNPARLQFITDRCDLDQKSILDIGCGGGLLSESLAKRGASVTGIDASLRLIETARQHAEEARVSNLTYLHSCAEQLAKTKPHAFDIITCLELLEHVPDPVSLIAACAMLIKPGGKLFFSTINRNPKSYLLAIVGAERLLRLLPKNTHQYAKFIKPSELDQALRDKGIYINELSGLTYNPFSRKTKLCSDVSINYLVYAQYENSSL